MHDTTIIKIETTEVKLKIIAMRTALGYFGSLPSFVFLISIKVVITIVME